jgi:uncharacterized membrane protein
VTTWLGGTRGLAVLLVASLGANLFLGGLVAGRIAGEATQGSQTRRSIHAMLAPLPDVKRELVRREINAAMPQVRREFSALQKARAALMEELAKGRLDSAAIERGFADVRTHTAAIRTEIQQAMMRAMPALTQEERRALVQALARQPSGGALP